MYMSFPKLLPSSFQNASSYTVPVSTSTAGDIGPENEQQTAPTPQERRVGALGGNARRPLLPPHLPRGNNPPDEIKIRKEVSRRRTSRAEKQKRDPKKTPQYTTTSLPTTPPHALEEIHCRSDPIRPSAVPRRGKYKKEETVVRAWLSMPTAGRS